MLALTEQDVVLWFLVLGSSGVIAMGVDKGMAHFHWGDRISERSLWLIAFAGGFWGIILGAFLFHHKTSKGAFWPPLVIAVMLWVAVVVLFRGYFGL